MLSPILLFKRLLMLLERIFFTGNQKFFTAFDELAGLLRKMSQLLYAGIRDGDERIQPHVREMEDVERVTVERVRSLLMELARNLITPFDREDIHALATGLNSVARSMLNIARQIRNYNLNRADGVAEIIMKQTSSAINLLALMLSKLKNAKELAALAKTCAEIHEILYACGDLLDAHTAALLESEKSEYQVIKMVDHYESLQKLQKSVRETVNVCESIIIKYA